MPKLVDEIFAAVATIRNAGTTVLIVEQRLTECLEIADRAYIAADRTGDDERKARLKSVTMQTCARLILGCKIVLPGPRRVWPGSNFQRRRTGSRLFAAARPG